MAIIYYVFDPAQIQLFPKCPFLYFTGYKCPGCGSQRAVHELLHLNFRKAFRYNPLLVASIPYLLAGFAFSLGSVKNRFPKTREFLFGYKSIWVILTIVILFFIFRNI